MVAVSSYQKLPIAQKRALDLSRVREPAVSCPQCDMQVMPVDLLTHQRERCPGRREPGPSAKWVGWREVVAIVRREVGLTEAAAMMRLSRWSHPNRDGFVAVRAIGSRGDRKYLYADLVKHLSRAGLVVGTNKNVSEEP